MSKRSFLMTRRSLLAAIPATALAACAQESGKGGASSSGQAASFSNSEWRTLSDEDWKARLPDLAYRVLRKEATERAFTSPLNEEKRTGTYVCAGCQLPLFSSDMKYDSGTGWPSFFTVIDGAVGTKPDNTLWMTRTEYHCARCLGHQGHVFSDGPAPTGLRYCNNGAALNFIPAEQTT